MRFASLEHFNIRAWRISCVGVALASAAWLMAGLAVGGVLGGAKPAMQVVVAALVFYIVVSTPRRLLDRQRVSQARESVLLAGAAKACLGVTGSRSRTLVMLRPRDSVLSETVEEAARVVLLGGRVEQALSTTSEGLASYSAAAALRSLATLKPGNYDAGDEETRGLADSAELSKETKLPMFMTVCFFAPIMMLLYSVFSHSYDPGSLAELSALEFIVIDLAFYLSASDRRPR